MSALMASRRKAADRKARRKAKRIRIAQDSTGTAVAVPPRATLSSVRNALQRELNAAIRLRDGRLCISCGSLEGNQAGHLFAVGPFSGLRFHPLNEATQCAGCNKWRGGNHAAYAAAFIRRYGLATFEALDAIKGEPRQWRIGDLLTLRSALRSGGLAEYQCHYFALTGWVPLDNSGEVGGQ